MFAPLTHAEDLGVQPAPAPLGAEEIFTGLHMYEEDAAKLAYLGAVIKGAEEEFGHDPNYQAPERLRMAIQERYDQAMDHVRGISYRDGYVDVLVKDAGELLPSLLQIPTNTANKITSSIVDRLGTPAQTPRLNNDVIASGMILTLKEAAGQGPGAEFHRRALAIFYPQLNLNQKMDFQPDVLNARLEDSNRNRMSNIEKSIKDGLGDVRRNQSVALDKLKNGLALTLKDIAILQREFMEAEKGKAADEAKIKAFESTRQEIQAGLGLASILARATGQKEMAAGLDRAGLFAVAAFNVMNPTVHFASNPMTYLNSYATALNLGFALFSSGQSESASMFKSLGAIMNQLRGLSQQIASLEKHITDRLDEIDRTLKTYVFVTTEKFRKFDTMLTWNETELISLRSLVGRIHQDTNGAFMFDSGRIALRLDSQCLRIGDVEDKMDARRFIDCRNQIANLAVGGMLPDSGSESNKSEIFDRVAQRLARLSGDQVSSSEQRSNASAWLAGMDMLNRLGKQQPQHAHLLRDKSYSSISSLGAAVLLDTGRSFEMTLSKMAVRNEGAGKFALRRDLINRLINDYEQTIKRTSTYVRDVPNKMIRGIPRPNVPVGKQAIVDRPETYPAFVGGIGLCPVSNLVFENGYNGQPWPDELTGKPAIQERLNRFADNIKWVPQLNAFLPDLVRRALSTGFVDREHGELRLSACFKEIKTVSCMFCDSSQNFITLAVNAVYVVAGRRKIVEVGVMNGVRPTLFEFPFFNQETDRSPLTSVWNNTPPFRGNHGFTVNMSLWNSHPGKDIGEFERDFQGVVDAVNEKVIDDLKSDTLKSYTDESRLARNTLSFVLERGLENNQPAVGNLLNWVADSRNLPNAAYWADAQYRGGMDEDGVAQALTRRLAPLRQLLDEVEGSPNLRPRPNVFGARIADFSLLLGLSTER